MDTSHHMPPAAYRANIVHFATVDMSHHMPSEACQVLDPLLAATPARGRPCSSPQWRRETTEEEEDEAGAKLQSSTS